MSNNSDKSLGEYKKFMSNYTAPYGPGVPYTHSIVGKPGGKYNIPADKYKDFIELYINARRDGGFHLAEKPADISQLLIDIDLRSSIKKRQYTDQDIISIIKHSTKIIEKYYKINADKELFAFVFKKTNHHIEN